jgi:hypothetical protein
MIEYELSVEYRYVDADKSIRSFFKRWDDRHRQTGQACLYLLDIVNANDIVEALTDARRAGYEEALRDLGKLLK